MAGNKGTKQNSILTSRFHNIFIIIDIRIIDLVENI